MKAQLLTLVILLAGFILLPISLSSQSCRDASVELSAVVQSSPPLITIHWVPNVSATSHVIYRKLKGGNSWGAPVSTLTGDATSYSDSAVVKGISYEYRVLRIADAFSGNGYINSGIEISAIEKRGILILVVDSVLAASLTFEIDRLKSDFAGDGWRTVQHNVPRTMPVSIVKMLIQDTYSQDPQDTKAILLLGRVPVPYSGEINIDGHADHTGAYPADVYYADVNGVWTDAFVNNTSAGDARNHNTPGDGKFDQSIIPSDVELQIGRVDFFNMPSFGAGEEALLRNYLDKDHEYRHKKFTVEYRALIDDNFGFLSGEAFAASGWKNAAPLVGKDNVVAGDYISGMTDESYLWSYGCGGGWYQGANGVGSTGALANSNLQSVFTMLFGSYFGDWDTPDNFLRAALAQGKTLTNVWSGRPHWQFHHMGLGENIGYDVRLSQNNSAHYFSNIGGRFAHIAFMGDPTLRNDILAPVSDVVAQSSASHVEISWGASSDTVLGYYIYRKGASDHDYVRIHDEPLTGFNYIDSCVLQGDYDYMVRAIVLHQSPSGTYYNLSQGINDTTRVVGDFLVHADASFILDGNDAVFTNTTSNATSYFWDFGDGVTSDESNPVHVYGNGDFVATLIASNSCDADTLYFIISILTSTDIPDSEFSVKIYPNPSVGKFNVYMPSEHLNIEIKVHDITGAIIFETNIQNGDQLDLSGNPTGVYFLEVKASGKRFMGKIFLE